MAKMHYTEKDKQGAENLELRSEQLRDILGQVPRWIVRFGTIVIMFVLVILLIGSAFLKYPDVIDAPIKLTTETPPAEMVANTSARIHQFFISDKEFIEKDQVLVVFESASDYNDVHIVSGLLGKKLIIDSLTEISFPDNVELGSLQNAYTTLQKRIQEYIGFKRLDYYQRKINSVQGELKKYSLFLNRLKDKETIQQQEYLLIKKQYQRDSALYIDGVISSAQLEKSEAQMLNKLYEWKSTQTELASSQIEVSNLQQEILELELKFEENSRIYKQNIKEAYEKIRGEIAQWEQNYVIRSPFDGQVSFTKIWSDNQYVEKGEIVLTVLPTEQGELLGKVMLSAKGAGKVKEGYSAVIRFDNYPYMEFGTVTGKINSISLVPNNELYAVEIRLDSSKIITNYNIILTFQQNMPGTAEIITDKRSLLIRIIDPFRAAFFRQKMMRE